MDRWLIARFRNAPRGAAPAVLIIVAALLALRATTMFDTGSVMYRGSVVDSSTVNAAGVALAVILGACAGLAVVALVSYLRGNVRAAQLLLVGVAVLGLPAYLAPTLAAGIALWVLHQRRS